jgi:hypothetical protein
VLKRIESMLEACDTDRRVMPPTELFNEGWLLRVTLDWFANHPEVNHALAIPEGVRWYSEALLPSQFKPRRRGDDLAETHTHADGVIGHFEVGNSGEGDIRLISDAHHFIVVEAKLHSKLSSGTKNAPNYDQAARNVACMAQVMADISCRPEQMTALGFYVVAPGSQIESGVFDEQLRKESILHKVSERVAAYEDPAKNEWLDKCFTPVLDRAEIAALSWEKIGEFIASHDSNAGASFSEFYTRCLKYNRLAGEINGVKHNR